MRAALLSAAKQPLQEFLGQKLGIRVYHGQNTCSSGRHNVLYCEGLMFSSNIAYLRALSPEAHVLVLWVQLRLGGRRQKVFHAFWDDSRRKPSNPGAVKCREPSLNSISPKPEIPGTVSLQPWLLQHARRRSFTEAGSSMSCRSFVR